MRAIRMQWGVVIGVALLSVGLGLSAGWAGDRSAEAASEGTCVINLGDDAPMLSCPGGIVMSIGVTNDKLGRLIIKAKKEGTFGTGAYTLRVFDPDQGQRCTAVNEERGTRWVDASENLSEIEFPALAPSIDCIPGQKVRKGYCITKAAGGNPAHFCSNALVVSAELVREEVRASRSPD